MQTDTAYGGQKGSMCPCTTAGGRGFAGMRHWSKCKDKQVARFTANGEPGVVRIRVNR